MNFWKIAEKGLDFFYKRAKIIFSTWKSRVLKLQIILYRRNEI